MGVWESACFCHLVNGVSQINLPIKILPANRCTCLNANLPKYAFNDVEQKADAELGPPLSVNIQKFMLVTPHIQKVCRPLFLESMSSQKTQMNTNVDILQITNV